MFFPKMKFTEIFFHHPNVVDQTECVCCPKFDSHSTAMRLIYNSYQDRYVYSHQVSNVQIPHPLQHHRQVISSRQQHPGHVLPHNMIKIRGSTLGVGNMMKISYHNSHRHFCHTQYVSRMIGLLTNSQQNISVTLKKMILYLMSTKKFCS